MSAEQQQRACGSKFNQKFQIFPPTKMMMMEVTVAGRQHRP